MRERLSEILRFPSRLRDQEGTESVVEGHFVKPGLDPFCAKFAVMGLSVCILSTGMSLGIPLKGSK